MMQVIRSTSPAQLAVGLHRAARVAVAYARDSRLPVERREAEAKIAASCLAGILDVIGWPKRPASTGAKGARIDIQTILDAVPCTAEDVTPPAATPESPAPADGDVLPPKQ